MAQAISQYQPVQTMSTIPPRGGIENAQWRLRLYISGQTAASLAAARNITTLCGQCVPGNFELEVIDILENPSAAEGEQMLSVPMLVRLHPPPVRRIVGDLADPQATAVALNLQPSAS